MKGGIKESKSRWKKHVERMHEKTGKVDMKIRFLKNKLKKIDCCNACLPIYVLLNIISDGPIVSIFYSATILRVAPRI